MSELRSGSVAVVESIVERNFMGWGLFDFFKFELRNLLGEDHYKAGWYARKSIDGIHYFKWAERGYKPSEKYLNLLKQDGWITIYG